MAAEKVLTKEQILEALKKNGINNLEEFIDTLMPNETGGYSATVSVMGMSQEHADAIRWLNGLQKASRDTMENEG